MIITAFIPARGGSKGIPGKNIKPFLGKPLIVHSIEHALEADLVDHVFVSTDDSKIADISESAGAVIIRRPEEISGDTASTESAIYHGLEEMGKMGLKPDIIILMQATSPLRPAGALQSALEKFISNDLDSLLTLSPTHRFFWKIDGSTALALYDYKNRPRRQDIQPENVTYVENGSFYIFNREQFGKSGNRLGGKIGYVVFNEEYSHEIDSPTDFIFLETLAEQLKQGS